MEEELEKLGFKKYYHYHSGVVAWSKSNLCEYSDEWSKEEEEEEEPF